MSSQPAPVSALGQADHLAHPRLLGVLVTFRRPEYLSNALECLAAQDRALDRLVVVDNDPGQGARAIVSQAGNVARSVDYLPMPENMGFAGGVAEGMEAVLPDAKDDDWIVVFDDDDPPPSPAALGELQAFAARMVSADPLTAAVGWTGGRFDWRRGRVLRVPDEELHGAVPVDYVAGDHLPCYLVRAIRDVGPFSRAIFFGLSEIEFGLRLRRAGYSLYADGDRWLWGRTRVGRLNVVARPSLGLSVPRWKRYYSLRNTVYVLRDHGHSMTALRVTLLHGFIKPLANLPVHPRLAARHLVINWRACRDGWLGRMGRIVEPDALSKRELRRRPHH